MASVLPGSQRGLDAGGQGGQPRSAAGDVISVNIGCPREVPWGGRTVRTGIFKRPVSGSVAVEGHNLAGDAQADPIHHGGTLKAIYAYPSEHYRFWRAQLGGLPDGWGVFGENLTLAGLLEHDLCVGDILAIGSAKLRVTEPRYPCFKLGIRLADDTVVARFLQANRPGMYFSVEQQGDVRAGDPARVIFEHPGRLSIAELMRLRVLSSADDVEALRAALVVDALTDEWRKHLARRLAKLAPQRASRRLTVYE